MRRRSSEFARAMPGWLDRFGIRDAATLRRNLGEMLSRSTTPGSVAISVASIGMLRPALSLPAYLGWMPSDRVSPIFNLYDRTAGGTAYRGVATRRAMRDYRGGRLSYDEHDGVDFVCPPGTPLVAAAPGIFVGTRDTWLRGGLTACIDHGHGVVTQYTHLSRCLVNPGDRLARGDIVGLSGHSGIDMTLFFPWVPPHLHFSVWIHGRPIDPYLTDDETRVAGTWIVRNDPRPSNPLPNDEGPDSVHDIAIHTDALKHLLAQCKDPHLRDELAAAPGDAARVAIVEDSLHHQRSAWPTGLDPASLRPHGNSDAIRLSLPLREADYDRAEPADTWLTRPPRG